MLGVKRNMVTLMPHNEAWETLYEQTRLEIQEILGDNIIDIQHVGSTAVAGIAAKPILDIAVSVRSAADLNYDDMLARGYKFAGEAGVPGRFFFARYRDMDISTHHIHCYEPNNPDYLNQVAFRDFLNAHPEYAVQYNDLKQSLAAAYANDRETYTKEKAAFIRLILGLAQNPSKVDI